MVQMVDPGRKQWDVRLLAGLGACAGALYVGADTFVDNAVRGGKMALLAVVLQHVVDRIVPVVAGALAGIAVHALRLRSALASMEARRADDLLGRLHGVQRDQAVWVVAAATLHEVKNPLHSLGLLLDDLEATAQDAPLRKALMDKARAQVERANASLASLRSIARDVRPASQSIELGQIAAEVALEVSPLLKRDGASLELRGGNVLARADRAFVRMILENLLSNSLDGLRSRGQGCIQIQVLSAPSQAIVRVHDDGPGVGREARKHLFEPLNTSKTGGLGLGLAVARSLARAMQGDLQFISVDGWATTIELRLPADG